MRFLDLEWDAIFKAHKKHLARVATPRCEECGDSLEEGEILICRRCEAVEEAARAMEVMR